MLTVIAYDVTDDRRRERVRTLLADYGQRVNYSVFECELEGKEFAQLQAQLARLIDDREDRVIFYRLCAGCRDRKSALGLPFQDRGEQGVVIV